MEDTKINFDRARSTTVNSLLRALRAIYNISSDEVEDFFADELLVYQEWRSRYEVEEQANEKQDRKLKDCFGW